jgi:hypothetical protein
MYAAIKEEGSTGGLTHCASTPLEWRTSQVYRTEEKRVGGRGSQRLTDCASKPKRKSLSTSATSPVTRGRVTLTQVGSSLQRRSGGRVVGGSRSGGCQSVEGTQDQMLCGNDVMMHKQPSSGIVKLVHLPKQTDPPMHPEVQGLQVRGSASLMTLPLPTATNAAARSQCPRLCM